MRVVLLLLVLAVIGISLAQWLGNKPPAPAIPRDATSSTTAPAVPTVPTRPQDVQAFGQNLNRFIQDTATQRARQEPSQ